jgi:hypothetical protein
MQLNGIYFSVLVSVQRTLLSSSRMSSTVATLAISTDIVVVAGNFCASLSVVACSLATCGKLYKGGCYTLQVVKYDK